MPKSVVRTYSDVTAEALTLLAGLIRASRLENRMSAQEVADRAGISRGMLQRIEKADPKCEIGATFEVAHIVGVNLFNAEPGRLAMHIKQVEDKLTLLPQKARKPNKVVMDDF
ncbi:helix-turn-helix domain-containing protein [Lacimicrobium alkaliphilum]|uniref:XRE family transcriptional regulator n=1 Tax=Lacimicrobium alkaliphilum TaxID=1526571 RepID=A0A0U2QJF1_9ALTE|nr:helix-turn-helix transcriptional regulator [Lacimicrobium alkaliphilum]ALS97179.1 XRE family transcriptional regulator [Lacimicrobium alkaliphilum]